MNTLAVIQIPDFALQAVLRHESELRDRPVVLVEDTIQGTSASQPGIARNYDGEDAQRTAKAHIIQLTHAAFHSGVQPGMSVSQARARCRDLLVRSRSLSAEQSAQAALLECAWSVSSFVENTAPGLVTLQLCENASSNDTESNWTLREESPAQHQGMLAFADTESPPRTRTHAFDLINHRVLSHLASLHLDAQIGFGATPDLAWLAAGSHDHDEDTESLRIVNSADDLASTPLAAFALPEAMLDILHRWGIRTIGRFIALGRDNLVRRLGAEAGEYFDRATGRIDRPLRCTQPPETFDECIEFEHEVETLEPLLFLLRRMVEQLVLRLGAIYRVPAELTLRLGLSNDDEHVRVFKVPSPTANPDTLFRMLHTYLEGVTTEHAIVRVQLSAEPTRPVRQQFGLFETALRDPNQFAETLARLVALLGHDRVGTAVLESSHRPDAFRIQPADFTSAISRADAAALPLGLSLRRFRPPRPALVQCDRGPTYLHAAAINGRIVAAYGPMLLNGDWWSQQPWSRAEWDVKLADGTLCRIYEQDSAWFLEGCYD
jgi:protein ImuB